MESTISARFDAAAQRHASNTAFVDASGTSITYERLFYSVHAFAGVLLGKGVGPGDYVAIYESDLATRFALYLATIRLGAFIVLLPQTIVEHSDQRLADFIILRPGHGSSDRRVITLDASWFAPPTAAIEKRGPGGIVTSTSGTTGTPKFQITSEEVQLARIDIMRQIHGPMSGPLIVGYGTETSAAFHNGLLVLLEGQLQLRISVSSGASDEGPTSPIASLERMSDLGVEHGMMPPFVFMQLVEATRKAKRLPTSLKTIRVAGSAISSALAIEAEERLGCEVYSVYASTEAGTISEFRCSDMADSLGVVGKILPHFEYRFVDERSEEMNEREGGELMLKMPFSIRRSSYLNAEGPYDSDGWMHTGDIGRILPTGDLVLTGRVSDLINMGGTKQAPSIFETQVSTFEGVTEVAAFGIDNEFGFEDIGLAIVADESFDREKFGDLLAGWGPQFSVRVFFVGEIPYVPSGKVDRRRLRGDCKDAAADVLKPAG